MRSTTLALLAAALTALGGASTAQAAGGWLASGPDDARVTRAVAAHDAKLPAEFTQRLRYALPDGTLRVMVATGPRDAALEAFARESTTWVKWYGESPRFLARVTPAQLARLLEAPAIEYVEPDYPLKRLMSGSTLDVNARSATGAGTGVWSFDAAAGSLGALAPEAAGLTTAQATGQGVTVAIVDSGIDRTHKDFNGFDCAPAPYQTCETRIKRTVNTDHLTGADADFQDLPTTEAASGHGTHVAGTVAGNGFYTRDGDVDPARYGGDGYVFGVAPQASLVSVKNGDTVWAGLSTFGLQWILDHHAEYGIRAVNNSWGCIGGCAFDPSSITAELSRDLYKAGVLVLFAAGNDAGGPDGAAFSGHAQSPYVLGVAAYNHVDDKLADFSSRGSSTTTLADPATWTPESESAAGVRRPDIAAPGVNVWSARTLTGGAASLIPRVTTADATGGGSTGFVPYAQMGGTSMATPHVAGAAAILLSACPAATPLDVMRATMVGATRGKVLTTDGSGLAAPFEAGYGALDVRASLDWLRAQPACGGGGTANQAPTAAITAADSVRDGETTTFSAAASADPDGSVEGFRWEFGDGATATGASPAHAFAWPGTYRVALTVTDDDGAQDTATRSITVRDEAAPGYERVRAALGSAKCSTSAWEFTLSRAAENPARIAVTWADGSRELVALSSESGKTATYRTTEHLQSAVGSARADVPAGWAGKFSLARGPFCA